MLPGSAASHAREFSKNSSALLKTRGRGECRVPNAPAALCAHIGVEYAHSIHSGGTGKHPAFPTQWFYGLLRALPGDHRFVDPVIRATRWRLRELDACFGAPEPHGFTVRNRCARRTLRCGHRIPPHVHDDRDTPLCTRRDGGTKSQISEKRKKNIFGEGLGSPDHVERAHENSLLRAGSFLPCRGRVRAIGVNGSRPSGESSGGGRGSAAARVGWKPPVSFTRHRNPAPRIVGHVRLRLPRPSIKGLLAGHT